MHRNILTYILLLVMFMLASCQNGEGKGKLSKGADKDMKTYPMGRFSIDVPVSMKLAVQDQIIRSCTVSEFMWPINKDKAQAREDVFKKRLEEIKKLKKPENTKNVIIEERIIPNTGQWARGVLYYGNNTTDEDGFWDVLVDNGPIGLWVKFDGLLEGKEKMYNWFVNVAKSYQYGTEKFNNLSNNNTFYLQHGVLNLDYHNQEHTYARFEGSALDLKLEIKMDETHEVEKTSLVDSIGQFLISNTTPGLDIKKIRSQRRKAAGLKGEEIVLKMTEEGESTLRFRWQYHEKEDSGDHPEIEINMESTDGNIDAKLKVWDEILDSFKPMNKPGK